MRFALGNEKGLGVLRAADFVDKTIRVVNPSAPVAIPIFQGFGFSNAPGKFGVTPFKNVG